MWKDIKINGVGAIEKCAAEIQVWMQLILPYGKMKVKIFENQDSLFVGYTDVKIIRKFDDSPEGAVGYGKTVDEALIDTIRYFMEIVEEDYPQENIRRGCQKKVLSIQILMTFKEIDNIICRAFPGEVLQSGVVRRPVFTIHIWPYDFP